MAGLLEKDFRLLFQRKQALVLFVVFVVDALVLRCP